ncbi:MAG TPA: hypothetical protein DCX54_03695 [Flavobacteriales bacterium]|nr:hypothetical protein [Flavobacteriales bacterium]
MHLPWIVFGLLILGLLVVIFVYRKNKKIPTNYRAWFIIGITWIPLGIATKNYAFLAIGVVFMVLGLKHRDKWKETSWSGLSPAEKNVKIALISVGLLLLLAGLWMVYKSA